MSRSTHTPAPILARNGSGSEILSHSDSAGNASQCGFFTGAICLGCSRVGGQSWPEIPPNLSNKPPPPMTLTGPETWHNPKRINNAKGPQKFANKTNITP